VAHSFNGVHLLPADWAWARAEAQTEKHDNQRNKTKKPGRVVL